MMTAPQIFKHNFINRTDYVEIHQLLPMILQAADNFIAPPSTAEMGADQEKYTIQPELW